MKETLANKARVCLILVSVPYISTVSLSHIIKVKEANVIIKNQLSCSNRVRYEACRDEVRRDEVRRDTTTTKMATSTAMVLFMMKADEVFTPQRLHCSAGSPSERLTGEG